MVNIKHTWKRWEDTGLGGGGNQKEGVWVSRGRRLIMAALYFFIDVIQEKGITVESSHWDMIFGWVGWRGPFLCLAPACIFVYAWSCPIFWSDMVTGLHIFVTILGERWYGAVGRGWGKGKREGENAALGSLAGVLGVACIMFVRHISYSITDHIWYTHFCFQIFLLHDKVK